MPPIITSKSNTIQSIATTKQACKNTFSNQGLLDEIKVILIIFALWNVLMEDHSKGIGKMLLSSVKNLSHTVPHALKEWKIKEEGELYKSMVGVLVIHQALHITTYALALFIFKNNPLLRFLNHPVCLDATMIVGCLSKVISYGIYASPRDCCN